MLPERNAGPSITSASLTSSLTAELLRLSGIQPQDV
jgi:hypothetical protein